MHKGPLGPCLEFDSLALPPDIFRHEISRFPPIRKPPTVMVGGFVLDQMVTNFFVLNFLGALLVNGTLDLLIKSKLLFVHRRVQQSFLDTILKLKAKTVPTGQK